MLFRGAFSVGNPSGGFFFNPFDFTVKGIANTSVVAFGGKILALYEVSAAGNAGIMSCRQCFWCGSRLCAAMQHSASLQTPRGRHSFASSSTQLCIVVYTALHRRLHSFALSSTQLCIVVYTALHRRPHATTFYTGQSRMLTRGCGCARRSATCPTRWTRSCGLSARPTWAAASTHPKSAGRLTQLMKLRLALRLSCACLCRRSRPAHAGVGVQRGGAQRCGTRASARCARAQVLRRAPPRGAGRRRAGAPGRLQLLRGAHRRARQLLRVRVRRLPAAEQGHAPAGGAARGGPARRTRMLTGSQLARAPGRCLQSTSHVCSVTPGAPRTNCVIHGRLRMVCVTFGGLCM